jgi:hypothetical protein
MAFPVTPFLQLRVQPPPEQALLCLQSGEALRKSCTWV